MNALIHAPVNGAGPLITLTQSAPHPISHAPLPSALFPLIMSTWERYAPLHFWQETTRMSHALQQEITMVT